MNHSGYLLTWFVLIALLSACAGAAVAPPAVSGMKFEDLNGNGAKDSGEPSLAGWTIFVDYNDNDVLDLDEPSASTNANGGYQINNVKEGTWKVKEALQAGWNCSHPNPCLYEVAFAVSTLPTNKDFGNWHPAEMSGTKFEDANNNGARDPNEQGLVGWRIFVDYNSDGVQNPDEPYADTDSNGDYLITGIRPGAWKVTEMPQPGWNCTFPAPCAYQEDFSSSAHLTGGDFGNWNSSS